MRHVQVKSVSLQRYEAILKCEQSEHYYFLVYVMRVKIGVASVLMASVDLAQIEWWVRFEQIGSDN